MTSRPALAVLAAAAVALAGCSSSGNGDPRQTGAGDPGGFASKVATARSGAAGLPAGVTDPTKFCKQVKLADAQALLVPKITSVELGPTGCSFVRPGESANGDNVTMTVNPIDSAKTSYNNLRSQDNSDHALSGVGDEAYWNEPVTGESGPEITSHKGDMTCVVQLPADLSVVTITKSGNPPIFQVSDAAAAAFATKMGAMCNDVFAANA